MQIGLKQGDVFFALK